MDDDEMLKILREVLDESSEPPERATAAAVAAGAWTRLDEQLAMLVADSADESEPVGVRAGSAGEFRQLTYELDELTIECELTPDGLLGQVTPADGVQVAVVTPDGADRPLALDAEGRFLLRPLPGPMLGIRCTRAGRPAGMTPWVLV